MSINLYKVKKQFNSRSYIRPNDQKSEKFVDQNVIPFFKSQLNCSHGLTTRVQQNSKHPERINWLYGIYNKVYFIIICCYTSLLSAKFITNLCTPIYMIGFFPGERSNIYQYTLVGENKGGGRGNSLKQKNNVFSFGFSVCLQLPWCVLSTRLQMLISKYLQ